MINSFDHINLWSESDIEFDRKTGKKLIKSTYPWFCFPNKLEKLYEDRDSLRARLSADPRMSASAGIVPLVDDKSKANVKADIGQLEDRIKLFENSKQEISSALRDKLYQVYLEMSDLISNAMYSHTAQKEGFVNTHKEVRRMTEYKIPINNDIVRWFKKADKKFEHVKGDAPKTNRTELEKAWQILGHYIGEETYTETLRPRDPYGGQATKAEVMAEQD